MKTQSWQVDFDGPARHIVAETDPQSGRTAIRVDGRMAAKPMAADEHERTFPVGSVTYVMRRNGDELDLDIAPPHMQAPPAPAPRAAAAPTAEKKKPVPVFRIIGSIILTIVIAAVVRYGIRAVTYLRVPWRSYTHSDNMFRVNFAGVPQRDRYSIPVEGGTLPALQLKSRHGQHFYVVELIELPRDVELRDVHELTENALASMVQGFQWKLLAKEWGPKGLGFIAEVPPSADSSRGTLRGTMTIRHSRVYIVYAFVPRGESLSYDVGEFLRSFELAE